MTAKAASKTNRKVMIWVRVMCAILRFHAIASPLGYPRFGIVTRRSSLPGEEANVPAVVSGPERLSKRAYSF
jgi:hypothetical protein